MLKRLRVEVEESSPDACVTWLSHYELVLLAHEAKRYGLKYDELKLRDDLDELLGCDLREEVIEFDAQASGHEDPVYRGRRVTALVRIDNRLGVQDD